MVDRLNAGANVVTSIISADSSLEGVVNYDRELEERDRDSRSVINRLRKIGMEPASQAEFNRIIEKKQGTPIKIPVAAL
jgi:methylornithine synthase